MLSLCGMDRSVRRLKSGPDYIARSAAPTFGGVRGVPPTQSLRRLRSLGGGCPQPRHSVAPWESSLPTLLTAAYHTSCLGATLHTTAESPLSLTLVSASESRSDDVVDNPRRPQGAAGKHRPTFPSEPRSGDVVRTTLLPLSTARYSITSHEPPLFGPMWRSLPSITRASIRRCTLLLCNPNCTDNSTLLI